MSETVIDFQFQLIMGCTLLDIHAIYMYLHPALFRMAVYMALSWLGLCCYLTVFK